MSDRKLTIWERRAQNARAFDRVVEMYTRLITNSNRSTLPKGITKNSRVIAPSTCDFICDVELTVNRALSKRDQELFWKVYHKTSLNESDVTPEALAHIKDQVGRLFLSSRIYPTYIYFRGKAIN